MIEYHYYEQAGNNYVIEKKEGGRVVGTFYLGSKARVFLAQNKINFKSVPCIIPEDLVDKLVVRKWATGRGEGAPAYYACYNYKGGIGKTALTIGLGLALARRNKKVLLVDADPQSSLSLQFFGADQWYAYQNTNQSIWNLFEPLRAGNWGEVGDSKLIEQAVHPVEDSRIGGEGSLHVLTGSFRVARLETALAYGVFEGHRVGGGLQLQNNSVRVFYGIPEYAVRHKFDYVIFDGAPSFTLSTIALLLVADQFIAPVDDDLATLYGLWLFQGLRDDLVKNDSVRGLASVGEFGKAIANYRHAVPSRYHNLDGIKAMWSNLREQPVWKNIIRDIHLSAAGVPHSPEIGMILQAGDPVGLVESEDFSHFEKTAAAIFPI